jgi:glycosyltransferase involved in cell wall biosynthesis
MVERRTDGIICVSRAVRDSFAAAGIRGDRLRVVRNGIEITSPPSVDRREIRRRLGIADDATMVLTVARFTEQKGHRVLLNAIPGVVARVPRARFVWVGEGTLRGELQAEVRGRGLADSVRFTGRRDDVPELLAAADAFALPSRFEGLPLVVLEAMAAGLPVVATRASGTAEAIEDGVEGRLVEQHDAAAFGEALVEVLLDRGLAARLGSGGRARVREAFSATRMGEQTLAAYRELLSRPERRTARGAAPAASLSSIPLPRAEA